jgi:hypothetical protein
MRFRIDGLVGMDVVRVRKIGEIAGGRVKIDNSVAQLHGLVPSFRGIVVATEDGKVTRARVG